MKIKVLQPIIAAILTLTGFLGNTISTAMAHPEHHHSLPRHRVRAWASPGTGYIITDAGQPYLCSVGFPATDNRGRHLFLTAGHCGSIGSPIRNFLGRTSDGLIKGPIIGTMIWKSPQFHQRTNLDIGVVKLNLGTAVVSPRKTNRTYQTWTDPKPGHIVCQYGAISQHGCGPITSNPETILVYNDKRNSYHELIIQAGFCSTTGDSGSGILLRNQHYNQALGILISGPEHKQTCAHLTRNHAPVSTDVVPLTAILPHAQRAIPGFRLVSFYE